MAIADIMSAAESRRRREDDDAGGGLSQAMMEHLICSFYLLITTYSSLPDEAAQFTRQFGLLPRLFTILVAQSLDQRVRFSTPW